MFKYNEEIATEKAFCLVGKAIEAGFFNPGVDGSFAGEEVIAFMNVVVDGLTGKNAESNQPDE